MTSARNPIAIQVRDAAAGLSGLGLQRGDTIACWLAKRPESHVLDAAALHLGAASLSVDPTCTAEQAEQILRDSQARILVAEAATVAYAAAIRAAGRTRIRTIIDVDDGPAANVLSLPELLACAEVDLAQDVGGPSGP